MWITRFPKNAVVLFGVLSMAGCFNVGDSIYDNNVSECSTPNREECRQTMSELDRYRENKRNNSIPNSADSAVNNIDPYWTLENIEVQHGTEIDNEPAVEDVQ